MHIQLDSDDYPDPSKFNGSRFYKKDGFERWGLTKVSRSFKHPSDI
jgi:hypothetical protein